MENRKHSWRMEINVLMAAIKWSHHLREWLFCCTFAVEMACRVANDILIPEIRRLLAEGHEVCFTPQGESMRPWIEGGRDSVVLRRMTRAARRGDIVLAQSVGGRYVLHRVLRIEAEGTHIVLMGDGNLQGEEVCTQADIVGVVVRIENRHGHRKPLMRGLLWQWLLPFRPTLLWLYRKTVWRIIKRCNA